jgi:hypothetical protein
MTGLSQKTVSRVSQERQLALLTNGQDGQPGQETHRSEAVG